MKERKYRFKLMFQEIDLPAEGLLIGRSPECNLTLDDPLVSRHHARVSIQEQGVFLDDLGSRNGTLVNGRPAVSHHRLVHQDRVRIGGHEMVFVEEGLALDIRDRPTFALTTCSACGTPFPERALACPHCGVRAGHTVTCGSCGASAPSDAAFCAQCGDSLDGNTGPLQVGQDVPNWTERLSEEVIDRAIDSGRFEQASKMLEERAAALDDADPGPGKTRSLEWYSDRAMKVGKALANGHKLEAIVARWRMCDEIMPLALLERLVEAAAGWCNLRPALQVYRASVLTPRLPMDEAAQQLDAALERVLTMREEMR